MPLSFLTPWGVLAGLVVIVPLAGYLQGERRLDRVRRAVGLAPPGRSRRLLPISLAAVGVLLAAAATQPTIDRGSVTRSRPAAEVFVAIDTSRSMLASSTPQTETRLARAKRAAVALREELASVPVGVASFTDRALPHLFASTDVQAFRATVERAIGTDRPPPADVQPTTTTLSALSAFGTLNFFAPRARGRFVVLLSDFESTPFSAPRVGELLRKGGVVPTFVRLGNEAERIFGSAADAGYVPEPRAAEYADVLAEATGGRVFVESELQAVAGSVRAAVEGSERVRAVEERGSLELAPWLSLAALLPLAYVVRRRNLP